MATGDATLLDRALDAIGYADADARMAEVARARQQARDAAGDTDTEAIVAAAERALLDGGAVPDDLGAQLYDRKRRAEAAKLAEVTLDHMTTRVLSKLEQRLTEGCDAGFDVLRPELEDLMPRAREAVAALGAADTPEQAIELDVVDAWRATREFARQHAEIRLAQTVLAGTVWRRQNHAGGTTARRLERPRLENTSWQARRYTELLGILRDADQHISMPTHIANIHRTMGGNAADPHAVIREPPPGWSGGVPDEPPSVPWSVVDPIASLRYCCREDVDPWLPTLDQLRDAAAEADDAEHIAWQEAEAGRAALASPGPRDEVVGGRSPQQRWDDDNAGLHPPLCIILLTTASLLSPKS